MKKFIGALLCILLFSSPGLADLTNFTRANIWRDSSGFAWDTSPMYARIMGVSQNAGGPLINESSSSGFALPSGLSTGVYYLYLGNLEDYPPPRAIYLALWGDSAGNNQGTWYFNVAGNPGIFRLWKHSGSDYWSFDSTPIYLGWAQGTADLVGVDQSLSADDKNDVYLVLGIGQQPSAPVPIPAAVWLLGSGLVGLVVVRRKFKK